MKELEFIYRRHSVRNFLDTPVIKEHLYEIIQAATFAPSGKNMQNWHFVIVENQEKIRHIAELVENKNTKLSEYLANDEKKKAFKGMVKYHTVFREAPILILVYAGPYPTLADDLLAGGIMPVEEARKYNKAQPGIQNIAAALENLQLAAANLGYGTCWMTGPTYAEAEITEYLGFNKEGYYLAAMTPLGVPVNDKLQYPTRKKVEEVITVIR